MIHIFSWLTPYLQKKIDQDDNNEHPTKALFPIEVTEERALFVLMYL